MELLENKRSGQPVREIQIVYNTKSEIINKLLNIK